MKNKFSVIYEPKGRAFEYAPLACNPWIGCVHGCKYCYGPASFHVKRENWNTPRLKENFLDRFEDAAFKLEGDQREILFSFATDTCGTPEQVAVMSNVLAIAENRELNLTILTKNPLAALPLLDTMAKNEWRLGTTICFISDELRKEWEPGAPNVNKRIEGLDAARNAGVKTWVSVEPVVDFHEGIDAVIVSRGRCDLVKVGKWNHDARANAIDWKEFHSQASDILHGHPHVFKHDLKLAAGIGR